MTEYTTKKAWPYLFGGVALGAALGVLFARKTGQETRGELFDWLKTKREEGREMIAHWREKVPARHHRHEDQKKELILS